MIVYVVAVFIIGYAAITMEDKLKLDKLIPALIMTGLSWGGLYLGIDAFSEWFDPVNRELIDISAMNTESRMSILTASLHEHFGATVEILIFLIGAMTIVEIVDYFDGFSTIKSYVKTHKKRTLLWIITLLAFFLSSIIDNLTATIVLISIIRKLLNKKEDRIWYAGMIVIAANAGGAWSPIGDVTTTMLWIADKVTALKLIEYLFLPSLVCFVLPTLIASFLKPFKGNFETVVEDNLNSRSATMLYLGLVMIIMVPVMKSVIGFPPYLGMMFSMAIVALIAETISRKQFHTLYKYGENEKQQISYKSPLLGALKRIEMPSILFFLGILMTVGALESIGVVFNFGQAVSASLGEDLFIIILGLASAVIDNVPLVAASMGMFTEGTDDLVWHFIAFSAGTGGSILIIGSAAGVVAMGMEKINFFWYVKNISLLAMIGFFAGIGWYLMERVIFG